MPVFRQVFVGAATQAADQRALRAQLYVHPQAHREARVDGRRLRRERRFYVASLSTRTIVYKGLLMPDQLPQFYLDLAATRRSTSALALVHSRFCTNTFPTLGARAPVPLLAHNGEINTLRGNLNWMRARETALESPLFGDDLDKLFPIIDANGSDSATFDNALELLVQTGRSLPHAMMMMIPEAWQKHERDGPDDEARVLRVPRVPDGAVGRPGVDRVHRRHADRRGARSQRPAPVALLRDQGRPASIMASEVGVLDDRRPRTSSLKGRLQPGPMFLVDTEAGPHRRRRGDQARRSRRAAVRAVARREPASARRAARAEPSGATRAATTTRCSRASSAFGYTLEDLDACSCADGA